MPIIEARELTKTYRVFQKQEGLLGAVRGLYHREYREVTRGGPDQLHHRARRDGRLPGPQRRGQDHDAEDALRADLSQRRRGPGPRFRPLAASRFLPPPVLAGHGAEEPALVGPSRRRQLPAPSRDLLHPAGRLRQDAGRIDRTAGRGQAHPPGRSRALAGRADEDGADRGAPARPQAALARRADHRPGRRGAGGHPEMPPRLPYQARGDHAPDVSTTCGTSRPSAIGCW